MDTEIFLTGESGQSIEMPQIGDVN